MLSHWGISCGTLIQRAHLAHSIRIHSGHGEGLMTHLDGREQCGNIDDSCPPAGHAPFMTGLWCCLAQIRVKDLQAIIFFLFLRRQIMGTFELLVRISLCHWQILERPCSKGLWSKFCKHDYVKKDKTHQTHTLRLTKPLWKLTDLWNKHGSHHVCLVCIHHLLLSSVWQC